jgi:integrin beta 2
MAVCSCREGRFPITSDPTRCSSRREKCPNPTDDFQCGGGDDHPLLPTCIPFNLTCDGVQHCLDGSDEDNRYCALRQCKEGFFQCANNRCVLLGSKCNNVNDCGDFSDEYMCQCPRSPPN